MTIFLIFEYNDLMGIVETLDEAIRRTAHMGCVDIEEFDVAKQMGREIEFENGAPVYGEWKQWRGLSK